MKINNDSVFVVMWYDIPGEASDIRGIFTDINEAVKFKEEQHPQMLRGQSIFGIEEYALNIGDFR